MTLSQATKVLSLSCAVIYTEFALYIKPLHNGATMKTITKLIAVLAVIGLFAQPTLAQEPGGALKQIADIVASLNHFPSDSDKATLAEISGNESFPQGLRNMADAVANISHAPTAEGKEALAAIQASSDAPDSAKTLAGIIASINHTASADAKATLAELFP